MNLSDGFYYQQFLIWRKNDLKTKLPLWTKICRLVCLFLAWNLSLSSWPDSDHLCLMGSDGVRSHDQNLGSFIRWALL